MRLALAALILLFSTVGNASDKEDLLKQIRAHWVKLTSLAVSNDILRSSGELKNQPTDRELALLAEYNNEDQKIALARVALDFESRKIFMSPNEIEKGEKLLVARNHQLSEVSSVIAVRTNEIFARYAADEAKQINVDAKVLPEFDRLSVEQGQLLVQYVSSKD